MVFRLKPLQRNNPPTNSIRLACYKCIQTKVSPAALDTWQRLQNCMNHHANLSLFTVCTQHSMQHSSLLSCWLLCCMFNEISGITCLVFRSVRCIWHVCQIHLSVCSTVQVRSSAVVCRQGKQNKPHLFWDAVPPQLSHLTLCLPACLPAYMPRIHLELTHSNLPVDLQLHRHSSHRR